MWITLHVSVLANRKRFLNFSVLHNASQEIAGLHFLDRMSGYDLQPLHQRPVLFRRDLQSLFFCTGPAEAAKLQPFIKEKESVPFPYKPFNAVTASSAEQEKDILFVWIQLEVEFLSGRAVLPRLNSRSPGQVSLSGSQDPDGKRMMHLATQQEI